MFSTNIGTSRWRSGWVLMALAAALFLTGCGGSDEQEQAAAQQPHSMVPANLDTLLAETGSDLPENQDPAETNPIAENVPQDSMAESVAEQATAIPQVVEVETPEVAQTKPSPLAGKTGTYSLQVGSFGQVNNALALAAKVNNQGHTATVEQALVNGKTYHRVFVRGLASQAAAENLGEELRASLGISYLVLRQS